MAQIEAESKMKTTFQMSCPIKEILRETVKRTFVVSFIIIYFFKHEADFRFRNFISFAAAPPSSQGKRENHPVKAVT